MAASMPISSGANDERVGAIERATYDADYADAPRLIAVLHDRRDHRSRRAPGLDRIARGGTHGFIVI